MSIYGGTEKLFLQKEYSDFTVRCGDRTFNIHRAIVCTQSTVFAKMCGGPWKEAQERVIDLPEDDPNIFEMLLSCLYRGNYVDEHYQNLSQPSDAALHRLEDVIHCLTHNESLIPDTDDRWDLHCDLRDPFQDEDRSHDSSSGHDDDDLGDDRPDDGGDDDEDDPDDSDFEEEGHDDSGNSNSDVEASHNTETSSAEDETELLAELETTRAQIEQRFQGLSNALHLYIMANKYDVSIARCLACLRFWDLGRILLLETNNSEGDVSRFSDDIYTQLADTVDELYSLTNPGDTCIRSTVYKMVGCKYFQGQDLYAKLSPVVRKHEDFALDIAQYMSDVPAADASDDE